MDIYKNKSTGKQSGLTKEDLSKLKETRPPLGFFDALPMENFLMVYLLDSKGKHTIIHSRSKDAPAGLKEELKKSSVHKEAHQKAFKGRQSVYEWLDTGNNKRLFQNIILPMQQEGGKHACALGLIREVSDTLQPQDDAQTLMAHDAYARTFSQMIMRAREEEKRKIASALHDEIGSSVIFMNSLLSLLKEDIKDGKKTAALKNIQNLENALKGTTDRIKKVIFSLRPPQISEVGLDAAIKEFVDNMQAATTKIKFHYLYEIPPSAKMSESIKIMLYRIVQEAVNNAVKHSKAKNIYIDVSDAGDTFAVSVEDDGVGFKPSKHAGIKHLGLVGMKEGAAYLGCELKIHSKTGRGTRIYLNCPKVSYARNI